MALPARLSHHSLPQLSAQLLAQVTFAVAASEGRHRLLQGTALQVQQTLRGLGLPPQSLSLYGSLALPRAPPAGNMQAPRVGLADKNSDSCYVTAISDIDIAIFLPGDPTVQIVVPRAIQLQMTGGAEWRQVQSKHIHRFCVTQWTLVNELGVQLDLACISDPWHYHIFRVRQGVFRQIFWEVRMQMKERYGMYGTISFDAYVYLLKGFAAFVSRTTLTSFQALCLGMFSLQRLETGLAGTEQVKAAPTGLCLFAQFLRFCRSFFSESGAVECTPSGEQKGGFRGYRTMAMDLSQGGQWVLRSEENKSHPRERAGCAERMCAELFISQAEGEVGGEAPSVEWLNVLRAMDPRAISGKAATALDRWFGEDDVLDPMSVWLRVRRDLLPALAP